MLTLSMIQILGQKFLFIISNYKIACPTNIRRNSDKSKWVYTGYKRAFDGSGSWRFGNGFAKNVVMFGVDNSSSYHADNRKNSFLM